MNKHEDVMTITQNLQQCNKLYAKYINNPDIISGNQILDWCYFKLICNGKPDLVSIIILTELLALRHDNDNNDEDEQNQQQQEVELTNCFAYFQNKFQIKRVRVRKAASRLHNMGLITCSFRKTIINSRIYEGVSTYHRELDLKLNIDQFNAFLEAEVD